MASEDLRLASEGGGHPESSPPQASSISLTLQETSGSPPRGMNRDGIFHTEGRAGSLLRSASASSEVSTEYGSPLASAVGVKTTGVKFGEHSKEISEEKSDKCSWRKSEEKLGKCSEENSKNKSADISVLSPCASPSKCSTFHTPPQSPILGPSSPSGLMPSSPVRLAPPSPSILRKSSLRKTSSTLGGYPGIEHRSIESDVRRHASRTLFAQQQRQQNSSGEHSGGNSGGNSGKIPWEGSGESSGEGSGERFRRRSADCSTSFFGDGSPDRSAEISAFCYAARSPERADGFGKRSGGSSPQLGGRSRRYTIDAVSGGAGVVRGGGDGDGFGKRGRGAAGGEGEEEGEEGDKSEEQQGQGSGRVAQIAEGP